MPMARFFISLICASSALGMLKLSRMTLTFLSLTVLAALAGLAGEARVGKAAGLADGVLVPLARVVFAEAFTAAFFAGLTGDGATVVSVFFAWLAVL